MFKTLIEKLRAWSHPDLLEKHTKLRLRKLNSDFNWRITEAAKEGRTFIEISTWPTDALDISIEKDFFDNLEAEGLKIETKKCAFYNRHDIKISWGD